MTIRVVLGAVLVIVLGVAALYAIPTAGGPRCSGLSDRACQDWWDWAHQNRFNPRAFPTSWLPVTGITYHDGDLDPHPGCGCFTIHRVFAIFDTSGCALC